MYRRQSIDSPKTGDTAPHGQAAWILDLNSTRSSWIHHRKEELSVVDSATIQRQIQFHIHLEGPPGADLDLVKTHPLIPLMALDRGKARVIRHINLNGQQLSRPRASRERELIASGLISKYAEESVDRQKLGHQIQKVLTKDGGSSGSGIDWLDRHLTTFHRRLSGLLNVSGESEELRSLAKNLKETGLGQDSCRELITDLDYYNGVDLALVHLPEEAFGRPCVLTVCFQESLRQRGVVAYIRKVLFSTLSFGTGIEMRALSESGSTSISVLPPQGFQTVDTYMRIERTKSIEPIVGATREEIKKEHTWIYDATADSSEATLFFRPTDMSEAWRGELSVSFYANPHGFLTESLFLSVLAAVLLLPFSFILHQTGYVFKDTQGALSGDLAAALVLLSPAAMFAVLSVKESNRATSPVYLPVKLFSLGASLSCVSAGLAIALSFEPDATKFWWWTSFTICWLASARLFVCTVAHFWRVSLFRNRWLKFRRALGPQVVETVSVSEEVGPRDDR